MPLEPVTASAPQWNRLSRDLRESFPDMKGLSASNPKYMRVFAESCPARQIGQQAADELPWFHLVILFTKLSEATLREWYATQAVQLGWSRSTLEANISKPMRVAEYQLVRALPEPLDTKLPSIEQLESELGAALTEAECP